MAVSGGDAGSGSCCGDTAAVAARRSPGCRDGT